MRFGSVCSGIEAASVAWEPFGWKAAWFSEIEPFPSAVLKHHYPTVANLGDMTTLPDRILSGEVEAPDLFCGGTPCQAFSVAGLRKSLDDARGNLSLTFCEIANAIDHVRLGRGEQPCIVFWENVPGVLSTKDNAFGCFLAGLVGEDDPIFPAGGKWSNSGAVLGPQRAAAWRVLDAQYFGVAQRRRRVFVVAGARDGFDPAAVLFEWDSLRRDSAPRRKAGQSPAGTIAARFGSSRNNAEEVLGSWWDGSPISDTMTTNLFGGAGQQRMPDKGRLGAVLTASPLLSGGHSNNPLDETLVTHSLRGEGFDASEDGTGRGTPLVPVAIEDPVPPLMARSSRGGAQTLSPGHQTDGHMVAVIAPTLTASNDPSRSPQSSEITAQAAAVVQATAAVAFTGGVDYENNGHTADEPTGPLLKGSPTGGGRPLPAISLPTMQVRRLTPMECERLQGFPDGYTNIPWRGKPADQCPDGPRYKALGNSWAVPVVQWIGRRIHLAVSV